MPQDTPRSVPSSGTTVSLASLFEAERERDELRVRLAESEVENDQWQKKLAEVWAENERLKGTVAALAANNVALVREVHDLQSRLAGQGSDPGGDHR